MKDYGRNSQIGFGQASTKDYLRDMGAVLKDLHRVCSSGAALWMVLDTVKHSGRTLSLPWEIITRARKADWIFHDLVIWDKGRSLPWSHVGRFRGVFEYILLFAKGKLGHFALDKIRELDYLSSYWVRYPERYHPEGKAPSDIWHFPIPVQGSWSRNGIRHFCPFPIPLVARMISLTTKPGDIVLDPFAGSGTVLAVASVLGRHSAGIDVNHRFVENFRKRGYDSLKRSARAELNQPTKRRSRNGIGPLIVRLRMLKYPRTLFAAIARPDRLGKRARETIGGFVLISKRSRRGAARPAGDSVLGEIQVLVLARHSVGLARLGKAVLEIVSVPPLSKFGLKCRVQVVDPKRWKLASFAGRLPRGRWYLYTKGVFNRYESVLSSRNLTAFFQPAVVTGQWKIPPILSTVGVNIPTTIAD